MSHDASTLLDGDVHIALSCVLCGRLHRVGQLDKSERLRFSIGNFGFYSVFVSMFYDCRV